MKLLILAATFTAGVWFAFEHPDLGRDIKIYADLAIDWFEKTLRK